MTVFVVHPVSDNITPATMFGGISYVNSSYVHADELRRVNDDNLIPIDYRINMEWVALGFDPDRDFMLIAGDHLQLLALTAILIGRYGYLTVLRWDRKILEYIPVRISSGVVPPAQPVLVSGTHIGETDGESRIKEIDTAILELGRIRAGLQAPLTRRDPFTQDDN